MEVGTLLRFILVLIMVVGFLAQMWELFGQFLSGLKTVSVSFEERNTVEFPSFAFCDSRAVRSRMSTTVNAAHYNATTFKMEEEIKLQTISDGLVAKDGWEKSYKSKLVPTMLNGYCKLFEFLEGYPINTFLGKLQRLIFLPKNTQFFFPTSHFSVLLGCKQII